jgi:hypothetical protein
MEGRAETYFYKMPVDDNGLVLLRTVPSGKNLFSLEIYGKDGKLDLRRLGGATASNATHGI